MESEPTRRALREAYLRQREQLLKSGVREGSTRIVALKEERAAGHRRDAEVACFPLMLRADVDGSLEAIMQVLDTYKAHDQCRLQIVDFDVGPPNESHIQLAADTHGDCA